MIKRAACWSLEAGPELESQGAEALEEDGPTLFLISQDKYYIYTYILYICCIDFDFFFRHCIELLFLLTDAFLAYPENCTRKGVPHFTSPQSLPWGLKLSLEGRELHLGEGESLQSEAETPEDSTDVLLRE